MAMGAIGRAMVAVLCCLPMLAGAAKPLKSPAAELRSRYTVIASGTIVGAGSTLVLNQVQPVDGRPEPGETLELRIPDWLAPRLATGERVLVAYSPFRRDPTLVDRRILDGDGPRLLLVAGLEPALLRDTPQTRARLLGADGAARHPTLDEALLGLRDPDPQWQNYYAHELALAPTLRAALGAQHRPLLGTLIADDDAHPSARALWLRLADTVPTDDTRWWHAAALAVLTRTSTDGLDDPLSGRAALVRAAFDALERAQVAVPTSTLARWVGSAQSALAESALLAARRTAPDTEDALIDAALARALLPAPTRGFLIDHRRRLALMREALAQRKAGDAAGTP
jgi:hypothetical protein